MYVYGNNTLMLTVLGGGLSSFRKPVGIGVALVGKRTLIGCPRMSDESFDIIRKS